MNPATKKSELALVLPGIAGSVSAIIIGLLVLIFAYPSLGRQSEYGYMISPGAGAILFALLGLAGAGGAALGAGSRVAVRLLAGLLGGLSLLSMGVAAIYGEWTACAIALLIGAVVLSAARRGWKEGTGLLLLVGLVGFPVGQASMNFLPYGWKTWAVPGVLLVSCGLLFLAEGRLDRLPLMSSGSVPSRLAGRFFYSLATILLIVLAMALLIHVPAQSAGEVRVADAIPDALQPEPWGFGNASGSSIDEGAGLGGGDRWKEPREQNVDPNRRGGQPGARIAAPEDMRTFPQGESILFEAEACGIEPRHFLWSSSRDGAFGNEVSFSYSNLSEGWHTITLTITDSSGARFSDSLEIGIAKPWVCSKVNPRPRYYPPDTPCQDVWPNGTDECQEIEVCHPDLDYIVADAVRACQDYQGDRKRCRALYIIRSFGPEARYMQGYALFKACCSGYPECTRTCWPGLAGTCSFREGFNANVSCLDCRPDDWGVSAWRSDTNMSQNSAVLGLFPTHATVNILQTGVCVDYAAAVTTLLRKAGYSSTEAMSTASMGYDLPLLGNHPGHAYNLVLLPGDSRYHFVDTTGNGEGINLGGLPHYFWFTGCFLGQPVKIRVFDWWVGYCNKTGKYGYNDAGDQKTPKAERICGCSWEKGAKGEVQSRAGPT